ncbi:hypothetical protein BRADI_4g09622v3 [Brachypodium distachyon]|uniref:FBD domain-containing protein n=1 Tax=Brachypodium distachyon TaxID=15368 RepID=A0A0Q3H1D6_BRADI|nr:hypothetical protein BRADI_4g09622v3 [Brachypodium distachyon]
MNFLQYLDLEQCENLVNLPDSIVKLVQLRCLNLPDEVLKVNRAPCIKRVGTEFLRPSQPAAASFPRLNKMVLKGMVEWEEWEWEEKVQAMSRLEKLSLQSCKLRLVPPGLASNAWALRKLSIQQVKQISYLEKFPSVVELTVDWCPDLERISNLPKVQKLTITRCPKLKVLKDVPELRRLVLEGVEHLRYLENIPFVVELTVVGSSDLETISNLPKLQKLTITRCPKLKVLKDVPALQRLVLVDGWIETLPEYVRDVTPRHLEVTESFIQAMVSQRWPSTTEMEKIKYKFDKIMACQTIAVLYMQLKSHLGLKTSTFRRRMKTC